MKTIYLSDEFISDRFIILNLNEFAQYIPKDQDMMAFLKKHYSIIKTRNQVLKSLYNQFFNIQNNIYTFQKCNETIKVTINNENTNVITFVHNQQKLFLQQKYVDAYTIKSIKGTPDFTTPKQFENGMIMTIKLN